MTDDDEEWRAILGYEDLYDVSNWGRVRSYDQILNRKNGSVNWKGRILKPQRGSKGHYGVNLHRNGKSKTHYIHQLVARAFLDNPDGLPVVRHLDDVKENNHVSNLAWGTWADNSQDAIRNGRSFDTNSHKTHCPQDHPYAGENLYISPSGARHCVTCRRDKAKIASRERRGGGLPPGHSRHGTANGAINYGCKCHYCSKAVKEYRNNRKERGTL